jgi:imidazolonepropionase-like amidohydrolase
MPWSVRAVPLPDGDRPADLWIDATGCASAAPVPGAEPLPGRYVAPGLVDAHAHPCVGPGPVARNRAETLDELTAWAASGVCLVRDTGSPGGSVLQLDPGPGRPRLQAAGRFLAPAGRYFPALLPEEVPQQRLTELALAELARGARWVKVIADFPPVVDGTPAGPAGLTYSPEAVGAMTAAVHAAGGRVAAHVTTDAVAHLVRAGVDSVEHGTALDESTLRLMAQAGTAWTPTLCAVFAVPGTAPETVRRRVAEYRERLGELLPLAHRLGVPILTGSDVAGTLAREVALLAEHGLPPAAALAAATTTGYRFLGEPFDQPGRPATLVTYQDDPREDLGVLSSPSAVLIDGIRVR